MSSMTMSGQLPDPRLRKVYCLEVTLGEAPRCSPGSGAERTSTRAQETDYGAIFNNGGHYEQHQ